MSTVAQVLSLVQSAGTDIGAINKTLGKLVDLTSVQRNTIVAAINELNSTISDANALAQSLIKDGVVDSNFAYSSEKITALLTGVKNEILAGAPADLDTLAEISAILINNENQIATLLTKINEKVSYNVQQTLTAAEQKTAQINIGIGELTNQFNDYNTARNAMIKNATTLQGAFIDSGPLIGSYDIVSANWNTSLYRSTGTSTKLLFANGLYFISYPGYPNSFDTGEPDWAPVINIAMSSDLVNFMDVLLEANRDITTFMVRDVSWINGDYYFTVRLVKFDENDLITLDETVVYKKSSLNNEPAEIIHTEQGDNEITMHWLDGEYFSIIIPADSSKFIKYASGVSSSNLVYEETQYHGATTANLMYSFRPVHDQYGWTFLVGDKLCWTPDFRTTQIEQVVLNKSGVSTQFKLPECKFAFIYNGEMYLVWVDYTVTNGLVTENTIIIYAVKRDGDNPRVVEFGRTYANFNTLGGTMLTAMFNEENNTFFAGLDNGYGVFSIGMEGMGIHMIADLYG